MTWFCDYMYICRDYPAKCMKCKNRLAQRNTYFNTDTQFKKYTQKMEKIEKHHSRKNVEKTVEKFLNQKFCREKIKKKMKAILPEIMLDLIEKEEEEIRKEARKLQKLKLQKAKEEGIL